MLKSKLEIALNNSKSNQVLIIAEAGVNHNGDIGRALELIDCAAEAKADIVKFQTFTAETLVTRQAKMADYQKINIGSESSQFKMLKEIELKQKDHQTLISHCQKRNIRFLSTGFDLESIAFLKTLKMGLWKIPSGELTNLPYLEYLAEQNDPVIISTGMANLKEIGEAIAVFKAKNYDLQKLTVLHCNTDYPTPYKDVNLRVLNTIRDAFGVPVGYSDHTMGIEVSLAAVALGATVIEKHFTLDRNLLGPDHKASLEPKELAAMVSGIRIIEDSLGGTEKSPTPSETKNIAIARKSIVAKASIKKGEVFTTSNLTTKRPGSGISPMKWHEILGTKASKDYAEDDLI